MPKLAPKAPPTCEKLQTSPGGDAVVRAPPFILFITGIVEGKKTGTDMIYSQDPNLSIHIPWPSVRKPLRTEDPSPPQQGSDESTLGVTRERRACCVNSWERPATILEHILPLPGPPRPPNLRPPTQSSLIWEHPSFFWEYKCTLHLSLILL